MNNEMTVLLQAMREAGAAILNLQKTGFEIAKKANNDIVTQADLLANAILKRELSGQFPEYGWLSEESIDDASRMHCARVWVVDPIDGTKEFATGIPEYAISVALVEHGQPILSAVFNPAMGELFHASKGQGAWLGSKKLSHAGLMATDNLMLLASRSEYKRGEWKTFQQSHRVSQVGSIAYKLALIAAGIAHATFSLGPKNEWDVAAGALLVTEAGGVVTNKHRQALQFNRQDVKVDGIIATTAETYEQVLALF